VFCDSGRIAEVLSNLVGNALKFTPDGGSVVVSVHRSRESAQDVCFSVRDTGVGIPSDAIPHLFDRFWQKSEHAVRGTGLGLFIAKGLVDAHHGRIWVTSRPGEGSEFLFVLPAVDDRST
jgi:signal transduction histidine kinase